MKTRNNATVLIANAVILLLILATAQVVMADRKGVSLGPEGQTQFALPMDKVTIEKKTLTEVITNIGREYSLSSGTIIVGLDGRQVGIRKMLVPCEAEITYRSKANAREVERIQIKRISPNASWQWFSKNPE